LSLYIISEFQEAIGDEFECESPLRKNSNTYLQRLLDRDTDTKVQDVPQHSGFNGHPLDPATEQMISTASEAQPPSYDSINVTHQNDHHDNGSATPIFLQLIGVVLLCLLLYNFIRAVLMVKQG